MRKIIKQYRGRGPGISSKLSRNVIRESRVKAFIMAGGIGSRLYPLSSQEMPKQFVKLLDGKSLFQLTVERNKFLGKSTVITQDNYLQIVLDQLKEISEEADIIIEPSIKNTRGCAVIASYYARKNGYANVVLIPSDHMIDDIEGYEIALMRAAKLVDKYKVKEYRSEEMFKLEEDLRSRLNLEPNFFDDEMLFNDYADSSVKCNAVAIGIAATRPSADFGYIETNHIGVAPGIIAEDICSQEKVKFLDQDKYKILHNISLFKEKPQQGRGKTVDLDDDLKNSKSENCFWNSGIYFFDTEYILNLARDQFYNEALLLEASVVFAKLEDSGLFLEPRYFNQVSSMSIEEAFSKKMTDIFMIEASFSWRDLGLLKNLVKYLIDNKITSKNQDIRKTNYTPIISQLENGAFIIFKGKLILANENDLDNISISDINTDLGDSQNIPKDVYKNAS